MRTANGPTVHNPSAILVPDTFLPMDPTPNSKISPLVEAIQDEFGDEGPIEYVPIARKYWNDQDG